MGLLALLFLALQAWWLSRVVLNRPRQPQPMSKPILTNMPQGERNALQQICDRS